MAIDVAATTYAPIRRRDLVDGERARSASRRSRLWLGYLACAVPLSILYFIFPGYHSVLWTSLGLSSVVATVVGVSVHKPRQRAPWYLLAAAEFCFISGDTTYNLLVDVLHQDNPFPSPADAFYLLTYLFLGSGVFLFIRGRSSLRDRASLIDALIITIGAGLLSWVYLIVPGFEAEGLTQLQQAISVAYPLCDVLVLLMLARLVAGGGGVRLRAMQLFVLGGVGLMAADVLYGLIQLNGVWQVGGPVDVGWVIFYVAWGCAALHPSMTAVSEIPPRRSVRMGRSRLVMLTSVSLVAPAVLVIDSITGTVVPAVEVGVFSAALFLLVITRLWGVLQVHGQSLQRERDLRSTCEALVAARTLPDIYQVALDGARALTGPRAMVRAAIYLDGADGLHCVASSGAPHDADVRRDLWAGAVAGGRLDTAGTLSVAPLRHDLDEQGMLVVDSATPLTLDEHGALCTLAAQVALAVASATLAEAMRSRQTEERFRGILQHTSDIIVILNASGTITYSTPSLGRILGCPADDVLGHQLSGFLHADDGARATAMISSFAAGATQTQAIADWRLRRRDGALVAFEVLSNNLLEDPRVGGVVLTMRDVSERRALEGQLRHQAFHDALSGLPNRALFQDRAEHALARNGRLNTIVAMVLVDIDDFKLVNDSRGHAAGDELLLQVAARLQSALRHDATVSRLGGDEFAILVEDLATAELAQRVAERALEPFSTPFTVQGEQITVRASAGLALAGDTIDGCDLTELMRCADLALYAAKERGKGRIVRYHDDLSTGMLERLTRRADLQRALDQKEFLLMFQPVVIVETGEMIGLEALLRWRHPTNGVVPPLDFIDLAEETGMIVELGRWVLDSACAQLRIWMDEGNTDLQMAVNVSARQLREVDFVDDVQAALQRHRIRPDQLVLELTESIFALDAASIAEQLRALRGLGVKIAMDDFGTGYSSLSYLQKFQLDTLKIDKSFVDGLGRGNDQATALVNAIISLARSLQLEVVAEGIELVGQRDELWSMGCSLGQGYLYSRPIDADHVSALLPGSA